MPQQARVIAGRYQLESLIGEGGMASVWQARDLTLERAVAVKLLFARDDRDKQRLVQQFLREARIAASVHHRNVIHIVDFGTTEEAQPFMVMELLEGESLGHRMHRDPPLAIADLVHVALLTLRGLAAVHDAGIIHRDLKPDNVFLTRDRSGVLFPKILDFGISRSIEPRSGRRSALTTRDGMIVGTPEYMSPEQARGVRSIDKRTDIYSMGCILYEAMTGELPFQCENVGDLIIAIVTGTTQPVHERNPKVPRLLSDVVARAMARSADDRFHDASQMQEALLAAAETVFEGKLVTLSDLPPSAEAMVAARNSQERLRTLEFPLESDPDPKPAPLRAAIKAPPPAGFSAIPVVAEDVPETLQPSRRRRNAPLAVAAAALAGFAALLLWRNANPQTDELRVTPLELTTNSAAAPAVAESATITVELRNLPANASVTVDGIPAAGSPIELPRDRRNRVIRVVAPGKAAWQAVHHASAGGSYDVWLVDRERPAAAARNKKAATSQVRATTARPKVTKKPPSALRKLDF